MQPPGSLSKGASATEEWLQLCPISPRPSPFQEPSLSGSRWLLVGQWRVGVGASLCAGSPGPRVWSLSALAPQLCYAMLCYAMLCYAKSLQSCLTLCDPIDSSPPGSPDPGILQARTLEWAAISFSNA